MTTTAKPYTETDVDWYAHTTVGTHGMEPHPDHVGIVRAVLDALAQDCRLLAPGEDRDDMLADLADLSQAQAVIDATRRISIEADARHRAQLLAALGREDDGRTQLSAYIAHLVAQRDALKDALGREIEVDQRTRADRDRLATEVGQLRVLLDKVRDYVGEHGDGEIDVWSLREVLAGREVAR